MIFGRDALIFSALPDAGQNATPILLSDRHATRHARRVRAASKVKSNSSGISAVFAVLIPAPPMLKSHTTQLINVSHPSKNIFAAIRVLVRLNLRRSGMSFLP
jgi:hypothetical protein